MITLNAELPPRRDVAWRVALCLALPLALLPFARLFMLPLGVLALIGLALLVSQVVRQQSILYEDPALHVLARCFAFIWLPMLLSAIDAESPTQAWKAVGLYPLYGLAGMALMAFLRYQAVYRQVYILLSAVIVFWALDGVVQTALGFDLVGQALDRPDVVPGHASSFFSRPNVYGFYMGALATLPLYTLHLLRANRLSQLIALLVLGAGVLVGASRGGWVMFAWALLPYFYIAFLRGSQRPLLVVLVLATLLSALVAGVFTFSPGMKERVQHSQGFGQHDYASLNQASSGRLDIWLAALDMGAQHPFNGVGVDSFDSTFRPYLPAQAGWSKEINASHPHHAELEIWAGAGVPGIVGFLLAWAAVIRLYSRASPEQRTLALPMLMSLAVLWWPLNTHRGFYASELASLTLFMLAFSVAALTHSRGDIR